MVFSVRDETVESALRLEVVDSGHIVRQVKCRIEYGVDTYPVEGVLVHKNLDGGCHEKFLCNPYRARLADDNRDLAE